MNRVFHVLLVCICSLNTVFDEHFQMSNVHETMSKIFRAERYKDQNKISGLTVIVICFMTFKNKCVIM